MTAEQHPTADPRAAVPRAGLRSGVQERLLDATAELFAEVGWRRVTMGKVADRAGLSRQTVYNEFGTKPALAEELVLRELDAFLTLVRTRIDEADDAIGAISSAAEGALSMATTSPLLKAILDSAHAGDSDLLPFVTQSGVLVDRARTVVADSITARYQLPLATEQITLAADAIVRLVLSHVTQPARPPAEVAFELAWMVGAMLDGVSRADQD